MRLMDERIRSNGSGGLQIVPVGSPEAEQDAEQKIGITVS